MRILFPLLLIILICFSCGEKEKPSEGSETLKTSEKDSADTIRASIKNSKWPGIYSGVLPCENCPGIDVTITLYKDSTFQQKMRYIDSPEKDTLIAGKFSWIEKEDKIKLEGLVSFSEFKIEELYLLPLGGDGKQLKPIPGNNFQLLKE